MKNKVPHLNLFRLEVEMRSCLTIFIRFKTCIETICNGYCINWNLKIQYTLFYNTTQGVILFLKMIWGSKLWKFKNSWTIKNKFQFLTAFYCESKFSIWFSLIFFSWNQCLARPQADQGRIRRGRPPRVLPDVSLRIFPGNNHFNKYRS